MSFAAQWHRVSRSHALPPARPAGRRAEQNKKNTVGAGRRLDDLVLVLAELITATGRCCQHRLSIVRHLISYQHLPQKSGGGIDHWYWNCAWCAVIWKLRTAAVGSCP
jgi:hypothetical protein